MEGGKGAGKEGESWLTAPGIMPQRLRMALPARRRPRAPATVATMMVVIIPGCACSLAGDTQEGQELWCKEVLGI